MAGRVTTEMQKDKRMKYRKIQGCQLSEGWKPFYFTTIPQHSPVKNPATKCFFPISTCSFQPKVCKKNASRIIGLPASSSQWFCFCVYVISNNNPTVISSPRLSAQRSDASSSASAGEMTSVRVYWIPIPPTHIQREENF